MVQILSPTGVEKPEGGELHSRAQYLRNLDRFNAMAVEIDLIDGITTHPNCRFVRVKNGTKGLVTAHLNVPLGSNSLPANTAANLLLVAGIVPVGFRPEYTIGNNPAVISGNARGDNVQYQILGNGDLTLRSGGAAFTTISGSVLLVDVTYQWSGVSE